MRHRQQPGKRADPAAAATAALPAPPHCNTVQRVLLQFQIITEQINRHLIPLSSAEPGDHDTLRTRRLRLILFEGLPIPGSPHALHPLGTKTRSSPGIPPELKNAVSRALPTLSPLTCNPGFKRQPPHQPMGEHDPDASPPLSVRVAN